MKYIGLHVYVTICIEIQLSQYSRSSEHCNFEVVMGITEMAKSQQQCDVVGEQLGFLLVADS